MKKTVIIAGLAATICLNAADGSALFKKCIACHGSHGEKHALNKSKIINAMTPAQIETALNGYKDGTYGGAMKALMKGQVATLSPSQIHTIAEYIGAK